MPIISDDKCFQLSLVIGNIPPYVAGEQNPKVTTPYSTEIMEEARTNAELRGADAV